MEQENNPQSEKQEDLRFEQLRREFTAESELSKGLFAFKGFGRSTEAVKAADAIGQAYQARVEALNQIIKIEKNIENAKAMGVDSRGMEALAAALNQAQNAAGQLAQQASERRQKLMENSVTESRGEEANILGRLSRNVPQVTEKQRRIGMKSSQKAVEGPKKERPNPFAPQISTLKMFAPKAQNTFKKPLFPIRKVTTI